MCFIVILFRWMGQSFDEMTENRHRVDAVATERLTSSKHVIDVYGYCGQSVLNEFADQGSLLEYVKKRPTSRDKLSMARDVALGVADLHGFEGEGNATIVHKDLKPANIVVLQGQLKLNDFNDAEFLQWNTITNRQCGFRRKRWTPTVRSSSRLNLVSCISMRLLFLIVGLFVIVYSIIRPKRSGKRCYLKRWTCGLWEQSSSLS